MPEVGQTRISRRERESEKENPHLTLTLSPPFGRERRGNLALLRQGFSPPGRAALLRRRSLGRAAATALPGKDVSTTQIYWLGTRPVPRPLRAFRSEQNPYCRFPNPPCRRSKAGALWL